MGVMSVCVSDHSMLPHEVNGVTVQKWVTEESLRDTKNFSYRPGDVVVAAYPKSGTVVSY